MSFKLFAKNCQQILRAREALPFYQIFRPSYTVFHSSVCWVNPVWTDLRIIQVFYCCFSKYFDNCQNITEVFFCQNKVVVFCIFFRRNQRFDKIGMSIFMYLLSMYCNFFSLKWLSSMYNVHYKPSCSIGHIWEHEICHLGCWAVKKNFWNDGISA